jgi:hypothetical protein
VALSREDDAEVGDQVAVGLEKPKVIPADVQRRGDQEAGSSNLVRVGRENPIVEAVDLLAVDDVTEDRASSKVGWLSSSQVVRSP